MDTAVLHQCTFQENVVDIPTTVTVAISQTWRTLADFSLYGLTYTFTMDKWRSKKLASFLVKFHEHQPRDPTTFGSVSVSDDGIPIIAVNPQQKIATVLQAVRDVISCLGKIHCKYQRSIVDYAIWYREKHSEEDTYAELITRLTCHCLLHSDFMAPNTQWELVQFG
jgi:putative component of membrane protein insertase Oxa1/YidC/SpoIIIJ protein YidD